MQGDSLPNAATAYGAGGAAGAIDATIAFPSASAAFTDWPRPAAMPRSTSSALRFARSATDERFPLVLLERHVGDLERDAGGFDDAEESRGVELAAFVRPSAPRANRARRLPPAAIRVG